MPRERDPKRQESYSLYKKSKGEMGIKEIAERLDVPPKTVSSWKNKDKWDDLLAQNKRSIPQKKKTPKKEKKKTNDESFKIKAVQPVKVEPDDLTLDNFLEDTELNERQRLFVLHFLNTHNATQSAIKAGYSAHAAHVQGPRMLGNPRIREQIQRLKKQMCRDLYIDALDVLNRYIKIAFADITDYLTFGRKEVQVHGQQGPLYDENGMPVMTEVNYVDFKDSIHVDGSIITEVKQGKDGVSIKLEDRLKALDKLAQHYDLFPDDFKRRIETEKLELQKQKLQKDSEDTGPLEVVIKRKEA